MSVLISGVLMNPAGVPVAGAEVTFSALTNGPSVLNGFSASVMTDQDGNYSIPLEICEYAISIQSDGYNSVYGSVSINEKSTPATINELLKLAAMEQAVTPAIIVYFREIQADVAAKLITMQTLGTNAAEAAAAAITAKDEAAQYALNLSAAVAQAQQASAAAVASANKVDSAKNAAEAAAGNAHSTLAGAMTKSANGTDIADPAAFRANIGLSNAMLKGEFGIGGYAIALPDKTNVLNYFAGLQGNGHYRCFNPDGMPTPSVAAVFIFDFVAWNENHSSLTARSLGQDISYELQNTYQDGAWKGWATVWNNKSLPNPMQKGEFGWGGKVPRVPEGVNLFDYFNANRRAGLYWASADAINLPPDFIDVILEWCPIMHPSGFFGTLTAYNFTPGRGGFKSAGISVFNGEWENAWTVDWNSKNLTPVTTNTNQIIQSRKSFKADGTTIQIMPETQGGTSYFLGSESDGTPRFFIGQDSQNALHVVWWNSRTNSGISLNPGSVNIAAPVLTVSDRPVLTVDNVAPPRQLHNAGVSAGHAIRIKLAFSYSGGGSGCLLNIVGGSGYNGRTDQQWVATLQVRAGNSAGDRQFSAILNTDFGACPVYQIILLPDPNDWNAVFVHFVHGTIYPGDTTINLVNKFFIDLAKSDIGGTVVNVADIPLEGRLPVLITQSWTTMNTTVDGNGNIKSASPIIKLFSDGSSELNAESNGVVTTRISEGVYQITGCLGLNADRAWGGDDGGITNPKCRNGYERIWNDYDVQEDGSLIIRTYHRVHSYAMQFAQNRLNLDHRPYHEERDSEEWPDRSPIDIPLGTYLTVRVQMPDYAKNDNCSAMISSALSNVSTGSV